MIQEMKAILNKENNYQRTENGAVGYKSTGKTLVDLNFRVSSMRNGVSTSDMQLFIDAMNDNLEYAIKWLFFARDVRGGMGEREVFQKMYMKYAELFPSEAKATLNLVAKFGRWKDVIDIIDMDPDNNLGGMELVKSALYTDIKERIAGGNVSLLAKWMPSINASGKARKQAKRFAKFLGLTHEQYRKMLSKLRAYIDVIEVKTCDNRWEDIDYNKVPSNANKRYMNAFKKHDGGRYMEHCVMALDTASNPNVKMHASVLFPHEIWEKYTNLPGLSWYDGHNRTHGNYGQFTTTSFNPSSADISLEAMWKNLSDFCDCGNTMVVVDGSGSMTCGCNNVKPIDVARSLGVYFSERCKGEFKNILIEFSETPKLINLNDCCTLRDKIVKLSNYTDPSSTDIEKVFMLILETAIGNNMEQSDLPDRILIVSDMEFDSATNQTRYRYGMKALFDELADRFAEYGYKLPKLIFWNVNSRTNTIPMTENDNGVVLLSGFSPNIMSMVMSGQTDPWLVLKEKLDSNRYDCISDILKTVK